MALTCHYLWRALPELRPRQCIIRVYNQFKYETQKKAALESWVRRLTRAVTKR
jgi:hypothetical protein